MSEPSTSLPLAERAERALARALRIFSAVLLVGIVLDISLQVAARYLLTTQAPPWTLETSLLMAVWLTMVAGALGVHESTHVAITLGTQMLPRRLRSLVYRISWLGVGALGLFLLIDGIKLTHQTATETFSTINMPMSLLYLAVPVGGTLIVVFSLANALRAQVPSAVRDLQDANNVTKAVATGLALVVLVVLVLVLGPHALLGPVGVLLGAFAVLLALGMPVAFSLGVAALLAGFALGLPPLIVAQRMAAGIDSAPLLAIPFFILAGQIMAEGGIAQRLVNFARVLVGPIPGGMALINIVTSMLFGGVSGSAVADVSATGSILIPAMRAQGYDDDYSVAVTVAGSTQGIIIPPSHNAIIYSLAAGGVSIGGLFLAGYIPGAMIGLALMAMSIVIAYRRHYPPVARPPLRESLRTTLEVLPGLAVGFIIVGGIVFGFFTATESGAIGVWAALLASLLIYRELTWAKAWNILVQSVRSIAIVTLLIATASAFAWLMAFLDIPTTLAHGLLSLSHDRITQMLIINVMVLALGAVMDMAPLILILTPVLLPIVTAPPIGMDSVQFGIVLLMNLAIGLTTPPVGTALFVGCALGNVRIERASRAMIFLWPPLVVVLLLVTYVPWFVDFLPGLLHVLR